MDRRDELLPPRLARDRLSGALSSAADQVQEEAAAAASAGLGPAGDVLDGLPDLTEGMESPLKRIMHSTSPWGSPSKSPRQVRRRRKKELAPANSVFHHTFVMKLFDRSVDLAQFAQNTALYPVCRAWMKNQPNNTKFATRERTPTPPPPDEDEELNDDAAADQAPALAAENGNGVNGASTINSHGAALTESGLEAVQAGEAGSSSLLPDVPSHLEAKRPRRARGVYKMPPCVALQQEAPDEAQSATDEEQSAPDEAQSASAPAVENLRIPELLTRGKSGEILINELDDKSPSDLIADHMRHWLKVNRRWRRAAAKNEERYRDSKQVLADMFES